MGFSDAINALFGVAEDQWPSDFTIDGDTKKYTGTYDQDAKRQELGDGGFAESISAIIVARKTQFASRPSEGKRVSCEGKRYVISGVDEDSHSYTFRLQSPNQ
jgi:hypothetical protein